MSAENIWIIQIDENQYKTIYAQDFNSISPNHQTKIVAGPFTPEEYLSKLQERNSKANKKYWIISLNDDLILEEGEFKDLQKKYNIEEHAKVFAGPYPNKLDTQDIINAHKFKRGSTDLPVYWILLYEHDSAIYEIFYGNQQDLTIKTYNAHSEHTVIEGPFTFKEAQDYINKYLPLDNTIADSKYDKFIIKSTKIIHHQTINTIQDYLNNLNCSNNPEFYELSSGPYEEELSTHII